MSDTQTGLATAAERTHEPAACVSCGSELTGRYCSNCGERTFELESATLGHFARHVVREWFEVDGKLWRTLRLLLFRPGYLSKEYCLGRRTIYVSPVRLLLIAVIVYAIFTRGGAKSHMTISSGPVNIHLSLTPPIAPGWADIAGSIGTIDHFGLLARELRSKNLKETNTAEGKERFGRYLEQASEPLAFTNVVLIALVLAMLFRKRRRYLLEHGVFSMHLCTFVFLISTVSSLVARVTLSMENQISTDIMTDVIVVNVLFAIVIQFAYLIVGMRRFYFLSAGMGSSNGVAPVRWGRTLAALAAFVVFALNSVFMEFVQFVGAATAIARL